MVEVVEEDVVVVDVVGVVEVVEVVEVAEEEEEEVEVDIGGLADVEVVHFGHEWGKKEKGNSSLISEEWFYAVWGLVLGDCRKIVGAAAEAGAAGAGDGEAEAWGGIKGLGPAGVHQTQFATSGETLLARTR